MCACPSRVALLGALLAVGCAGELGAGPGGGDPPVEPEAGADAAAAADGGGLDGARPQGGGLEPPRGGSSGGTGGAAAGGVATRTTAAGTTYRLIVPAGYAAGQKTPLLVVYSGTEGGATMAQNLVALEQPVPALKGWLRAVLDGVAYRGDGQAGADALDDVRARYDVDNDRTCLLGESAGTTAAFALGFHLRQSWFAAYWANDVAASAPDGPERDAAALGFAPFGQVGPGGAQALADAIAARLKAAGYRTDPETPYAGAGATQHGSPQQLIAAVQWLVGKAR